MEFGELNEHPAMEGKRKAIKDAWRDCGSDADNRHKPIKVVVMSH